MFFSSPHRVFSLFPPPLHSSRAPSFIIRLTALLLLFFHSDLSFLPSIQHLDTTL